MTRLNLCRSLLVSRVITRMSSSKFSYEDAVHKLNSLQSNQSALEQIRREKKTGQRCTNIEDMENYLSRTGVSLSQLDELSVVHVAGTKGKGSTSAMCESILRAHGFRTGLYTSPHLVAVRERIRLDGAVVSQEEFARHFHEIYNLLEGSKAHDGDMPKYFSFLTVLAFNMFLKEKVDVAIVEVGIGGIVDYTNVLRKVPVVGITALGLDHTSILGTTLDQIAAAKAGIMKPGCEAYTVNQPSEAMQVLIQVANVVQCKLHKVPDYKTYTFPKDSQTQLQVDLEAYQTNASLAIQLSHAWMRITKQQALSRRKLMKKRAVGSKTIQNDFIEIDPYITEENKPYLTADDALITTVPVETMQGLRECRWPGRYQVIEADYATIYLDGAHTKESMEICANWFQDNNRLQDKILIFSATGDRDVEALLRPISDVEFKQIFFVIPTAYKNLNLKNDNYSTVQQKDLIERCHKHSRIWRSLHNSDISISVLECVSDALDIIKHNTNEMKKTSVLITGSLHLVGAALSILDPNLSKN